MNCFIPPKVQGNSNLLDNFIEARSLYAESGSYFNCYQKLQDEILDRIESGDLDISDIRKWIDE
jgi:hypothetical protein